VCVCVCDLLLFLQEEYAPVEYAGDVPAPLADIAGAEAPPREVLKRKRVPMTLDAGRSQIPARALSARVCR